MLLLSTKDDIILFISEFCIIINDLIINTDLRVYLYSK